jgi:membrane-associated phospholipid phosphatase
MRNRSNGVSLVRIMEHLQTAWQVWLWGLLIAAAAAAIFMWLVVEIVQQRAYEWDIPLMLAVNRFSMPWLDTAMLIITWIGLPGGAIVAAAGAIYLWRSLRRVAAVALVVSFGGSWLLNLWLKLLFARPRPAVFEPLDIVHDFSFPSGHAMTAIGLYGFAAYLLWHKQKRGWAIASVLFGILIGFTRVYLGVHYPSDILGGIAVTTLWLLVVVVGYQRTGRAYGRWRQG